MNTVISKISVIFLTIAQIFVPFFKTLPVIGNDYFTKWSKDDTFKLEETYTIEKNADKDFVILNLTDIQLHDTEDSGKPGDLARAVITKLVNDTKPDLITLTGDNAWGTFAYLSLCEFMGSFNIPWATVMGNHDGEGTLGEAWCSYHLAHAENSLFKFGPKNMGYGNYVINIMQNGTPLHTLYMMDTHSNATFKKEDGSKVKGYDHLWEPQLDWYRWNVEGVNKLAGKTVQSTVFFHIPAFEYTAAWNESWNEESKSWNEGFEGSFGTKREIPCPAPVNNGFLALCKQLGSTKDMVCGHEHVNNYSIPYDGIRLTYALKTGSGCYWNPDLCGGTTITINDAGKTSIEHIFVTAEDVGFNSADFPV